MKISFFRLKDNNFNKKNKNSGLTLIEVLVVITISSIVTINLLSTFLRSKSNLVEVSKIVIADIRLAQANALASKKYNNTFRCGYGLYWVNSNTYSVYTGRDPSNCSPHQFNDSTATPVIVNRIFDSRLEVLNPQNGSECSAAGMLSSNCPKFEDIFFESPNADIWIANQQQPNNQNNNRSQILIRKKNATCPSVNCTYICIYGFGRIESRNTMCPKISNP